MLTEKNLFDGSIITQTDTYYVEPAHKYSTELHDNGIHTIVYKTSDVQMLPHSKSSSPIDDTASKASTSSSILFSPSNDGEHYCASERLRKKLKNEFKRRRKYANDAAEHDPEVQEIQKNKKERATATSIISDNTESSFNRIMEENSKRRKKRWLPEEVCDIVICVVCCHSFALTLNKIRSTHLFAFILRSQAFFL